MSNRGKQVHIYYSSNDPTGIRLAELINWSGQAIACPRSKLLELSNWDESKGTGVYILFGGVPGASTSTAYIGEAEKVLVRLKQHDATKDFWDNVIIVSSKDDKLSKAHIKYLESRLIELANDINFIKLENTSTPMRPILSRGETDAMEEYLENSKFLFSSLGCLMFNEVYRKEKVLHNLKNPLDEVLLYCKSAKYNISATGHVDDRGFVVKKDSITSKSSRTSMATGYKLIKDSLIGDGTLIDTGNNCLVFTKDFVFNSSSAASSVVLANSSSGPHDWKDISGNRLSQLQDNLKS